MAKTMSEDTPKEVTFICEEYPNKKVLIRRLSKDITEPDKVVRFSAGAYTTSDPEIIEALKKDKEVRIDDGTKFNCPLCGLETRFARVFALHFKSEHLHE